MLHNTRGIVLRSVRYGETSLISTIFTELYGVQSYLVQGVRSSKAKGNKAGLLQPATLLELVVYHNPQKKLQRIKEYRPAHIYASLQEEVVKNSIALFSAELLLRLLPENAVSTELFAMAFRHFVELDTQKPSEVANFPLWFVIACGRVMGYTVHGSYSSGSRYADLKEGAFINHPPAVPPFLDDDETKALSQLLNVNSYGELKEVQLNAAIRSHLLEWYIEFLHMHTQHLGVIRSLAVLQAILH